MREKARKFWTLSSLSARGCKKKKKKQVHLQGLTVIA